MGAPNAGKSTLVNALVGRKVSGVSPKPQTTRRRILGVRTEPGCQMVFVDTPGVGDAKHELNKLMNRTAAAAAREADVIIGVADVKRPGDLEAAAGLARGRRAPAILVLNKVDTVPKPSLLPILERLTGEGLWAEIVPVAALAHDGVDLVRELVRARLPEGPAWFEEEPAESAAPDTGFIQEVIQEALFARLKQEIPYSCAVQVETVEVEGGLVRIEAAILAERESHKPILVGAGGAMVKAVGTEARQALEKAFGKKVYLSLRVRVVEDWRNRESILADLGYAAGDRDRERGGDVV